MSVIRFETDVRSPITQAIEDAGRWLDRYAIPANDGVVYVGEAELDTLACELARFAIRLNDIRYQLQLRRKANELYR